MVQYNTKNLDFEKPISEKLLWSKFICSSLSDKKLVFNYFGKIYDLILYQKVESI